jgi:hypothetical protein
MKELRPPLAVFVELRSDGGMKVGKYQRDYQ